MSVSGIPFYNFCSTTVSVTPGPISANTSTEVQVTMPGITTSDLVIAFIKPTLTAGLDVGNGRVSAANTVRVLFQNGTSATITPATETYSVLVYRPEIPLGNVDALSGGNVIFK